MPVIECYVADMGQKRFKCDLSRETIVMMRQCTQMIYNGVMKEKHHTPEDKLMLHIIEEAMKETEYKSVSKDQN